MVHKFIPMPQGMKIPDAKAAVDKEWKKLETIPAWNLEKVKSKKKVILQAQRDNRKVNFAFLMDICHTKNAELEPKLQKFQGRVVLQGNIVKDDSGAYAAFAEQGLSASQMTVAKMMDVRTRLQGCDGQAADAASAYTQEKLEDAPRLLKIPKSEKPDVWIRLPRHKWPKSWRQSTGTSWTKLVRPSIRQTAMWKAIRRGLIRTRIEENTESGMYVCSSETRSFFVSVCGWH